jgi:hypothetical protein
LRWRLPVVKEVTEQQVHQGLLAPPVEMAPTALMLTLGTCRHCRGIYLISQKPIFTATKEYFDAVDQLVNQSHAGADSVNAGIACTVCHAVRATDGGASMEDLTDNRRLFLALE